MDIRLQEAAGYMELEMVLISSKGEDKKINPFTDEFDNHWYIHRRHRFYLL